MVQPLSGRYLARLFRGRTVQPGSRGSRPVFPPDDSQHRAGGFRGIFGRIRGLVRQGRPRCLRHTLAGRPGGRVHAAQDQEQPCYRVRRAGRAGAVPRRASAARGAIRHPFQYQRRHRGLDGCIHGLYTLSARAFSTFSILPQRGRMAWKRESLPCVAEPPAESPSTKKISA